MLKIGEYIRTKAGQIDKVINNQYYMSAYIECENDFIWRNSILKHSKNTIDLIEIGDYVNGYRVLEKTKIKNNEMQICILKDNNCSNWRTVNDKTLKSIVTKEQFASMEYKVKEE